MHIISSLPAKIQGKMHIKYDLKIPSVIGISDPGSGSPLSLHLPDYLVFNIEIKMVALISVTTRGL